MSLPAALLSLEPPLDPSGDEGRSLLRRELAHPEYYDADVVERLVDWFGRLIDRGVGAAEGSPPLAALAAVVVVLALVAAILLLVSRARGTARSTARARPALLDGTASAAELRARAEDALGAGDHATAVVDAFRALAVRQIERDRIEDLPQATAHELAEALGRTFPEHRGQVARCADVFDAVLYGDRPATREQALEALALDDELAARAVRR